MHSPRGGARRFFLCAFAFFGWRFNAKPSSMSEISAMSRHRIRSKSKDARDSYLFATTRPFAERVAESAQGLLPWQPKFALKKAGNFALGLVVMLAIFLLIGLFLRGMVWASEKALPWLIDAGRIAFDICVLILLPLCIFRKTRPWAGLGFFFASFLFGTVLFAFSCIVDVQLRGYGALIFGLFLAGVGVVPVAFFATLFHGAWPLFWDVVFGVVLTFGTRYLGVRLADQDEEREEEAYV